jgi:UDP-GlcNAc:undecaprenyl-phosphate/decaprenyl-phosphate GlcNAc-1-phosphate transferase
MRNWVVIPRRATAVPGRVRTWGGVGGHVGAPHPVSATLARVAFVIALTLPPVRRAFSASGLGWVYLVVLAFALALVGVPLVRALAHWWGVLDRPAARKVHMTATPLLGGAAVYGAFAATVLFNFTFSLQLKGVAVGATIVVAVGLLDDVFDVPARWKLAGQAVAVAVAMAYGVVLDTVPTAWPGSGVINVALTLVWFLAVTNALQFLDGMDGLAAGLGAIAALFFSLAALQTSQPYLMFLAAPLVGACLGFLPYNFRFGRPATIFLGDAGASFIGFTLAGLAVMGEWAENDFIGLLTPVLILAVPLFDIAFVGTVRVVTGKVHSVGEWLAYTARDHIHHRFEALGLTRTETVLLIFFIAATLGISAMLLKEATKHEAALVLIQAGCVLAIIAVLEGVARGRGR